MKNKNILIDITKVILAVVLAYLSFKLAYPIANSLVHIETGPELLITIWYLGPLWGVVFISIGVALTFGSWSLFVYFLDRLFFTKETSNDSPQAAQLQPHKKPFYAYMITAVGGTLITILLVVILFVTYIGYLGSKQPKNYKEKRSWSSHMTFTKIHSVKIYDDERVSFYINELQASTEKFVNAGSNYEIFRSDVHREMALYCLRNIYIDIEGRRTNDPILIQENILNNYVTSNNLQSQAKNSLDQVRNPVKNYPLADGYGAFKLDAKYPNRCDKLMTVDEMYQHHIPSYLVAKKKQLKEAKPAYKAKLSKFISMIQENFGKG